MRKKKKTWKDYSYSSLQFRVNKDRKSELEELLSTVVSLKNEKVSQNEYKFTKGELACDILEKGLRLTLKQLDQK